MMMSELIERLKREAAFLDRSASMSEAHLKDLLRDCKEALQQSQWVSVDEPPEDHRECLIGYWIGEHWIWVEAEYYPEDGFGEVGKSALHKGYSFTHYQLVTPPAKEQGS
jgi:hypothetical protein